MHFFNNYDGRT